MNNPNFMMLIGIVASGKSTFAEELLEGRDDIVYLSSDMLREELLNDVNNQDNNSLIFEEMKKRTLKSLKEGKHVIYDATNISRKKRKGLLTQLPKNIQKVALYFATDYYETLERNKNRDRVVPEHVIKNMYKNLQIPIYSEGWDKIAIEYDYGSLVDEFPKQFSDAVRAGILFGREDYELINFLATYFVEFFHILDYPQDSKYHSFSVSRHTYHVYKYILDNFNPENDNDKELLLWTALLHDIGKPFCKNFKNRKGEETKYANFISHDYVGSQLAINILIRLGYKDDFIYKVATLIQFHMYLLNEQASKEKLKNYVGEDLFNMLEILRDADNSAH